MLIKRLSILLMALFTCSAAYAAGEADLMVRAAKPGASVSVDRVIQDGKVLVSVSDAAKNPLMGLGLADFSVMQSGRKAQILSVQPMAESQDIPRHIVMVLDNSYSMYERNAIKPLLAGVDSLLRIVRPIDTVYLVVFDNKVTTKVGSRVLRVKTFKSSSKPELQDFVRKAYSTEGLTPTTVLYEAMLAGLDMIGTIPATDPRFMVVFSDGDDLNSVFKTTDVFSAAKGLGKFSAYAIDYIEGAKTNKFLSRFTTDNRGKTFKARSEADLVPIFESVASQMLYYYIVSYQFTPTGTLTVAPASMTIDQVSTKTMARQRRIDTTALTLKPAVDTPYGVARWKATCSNSTGIVAELSGEGNPATDINLPLPTDLESLTAGGDLTVRMELLDKKGQKLDLSAAPVKVNLTHTSASVTVAPTGIKIEEIKTIDSSPMLGQIFFDKGASDIPATYIRFNSPAETAGFDEQKFRDTLEKYYQVLNIVGKRLVDNPAATITLVGCNDSIGVEKGKKKLSTQRAESVRNYLQTTWGIAAERMAIEARNLPKLPSTSRSKEGQAENRRVEILSADPKILAPIRSTYLTARIDNPALTLYPIVVAPYGIDSWKISASNSAGIIAEQTGSGAAAKEYRVALPAKNLQALATGGDITVRMDLKDRKGQLMQLAPDPVKVEFIQTSQRVAQKEGQKVQEKYALILFDFDKDTISAGNQEIVNRIVGRIKTLPQATAAIVGYTDNIGKEAYNVKLSQRRALAVNKLMAAAYGETAADRIRFSGDGPKDPLFDNQTPEGRSFNRTVTITLEYTSTE